MSKSLKVTCSRRTVRVYSVRRFRLDISASTSQIRNSNTLRRREARPRLSPLLALRSPSMTVKIRSSGSSLTVIRRRDNNVKSLLLLPKNVRSGLMLSTTYQLVLLLEEVEEIRPPPRHPLVNLQPSPKPPNHLVTMPHPQS